MARHWGFWILIGLVAGGAADRAKGCTPAATPAGAVAIDAAWLQAQGPAPWVLDRPGARYVLQTDVFASGTAFVVGAAGVTLDLNCRRIVYGNGRPPESRNEGFEEGGSGLPGWTVDGAGTVARVPSVTGLWGSWAARVDVTDGETLRLESEPVELPEAPREYVAVVSPKGPSRAKVRLHVVDAATGGVIGSADSPAVNRGFAPVVTFSVRSRAKVRLRIEISGPGPVLLDRARIERSRDFGIVATTSSWSLPEPLKSSPKVVAACRQVRDFHLRNGRIQQGWGRAYGGSALIANWAAGTVVEDVSFMADGDDTHVVDATGAASFRLSRGTVAARAQRITNRMKLFAGVNLSRAHGTLIVESARFEGLPQSGVVVTRQRVEDVPAGEAQLLRINKNDFRLSAIAADGYAIVLVGVTGFEVAGNVARPVSGRGILLDGWGEAPIEDGVIRDNDLEAYERPTLEYDARGLDATSLRIRNWAGGGTSGHKGAVRRLFVERNRFAARTDAKGVGGAVGARLSFRNDDGRMNDAGNVFRDNVFRAVTEHAAHFAYGLSFSGVYAGVGNRFENNVYESNATAIRFGDNDSYRDREEDITLENGTVRRVPGFKFTPFEKQAANQVTLIRFVNVRDESGGLVLPVGW